jgi:predicted dithiol-disulfide oxidoreductase (DUF899 family)
LEITALSAIAFPNESNEYRAARNRLLAAEIALRGQMEAVAEARRALPAGGALSEDYLFDSIDASGRIVSVRFSELFAADTQSLVIYNMMFPRAASDLRAGAAHGETAKLPLSQAPCPSCTALLDQLDGTVEHLAPLLNLVVVAKTRIADLQIFAHERGWRRLRLLSSAKNTYNRDYHGEDNNGQQMPMLNVFTRSAGQIRHFWGSETLYARANDGQDPRHLGTIEPLWNLLDLTREGRRQDWDEQLVYPPPASGCVACAHE